MRGLSIVEGALSMRGIDPDEEQMIKEAVRIMDLNYLLGKQREIRHAFNGCSIWSFHECVARFLVRNFDDGYGWCARFKAGDLVESDNGSWRYGVVKRIVTEWNGGVEPECFCLEVSIKSGKTDIVYWRSLKEGRVRLADLPPEIMDLARSQVEPRCPLLDKEAT